MKKTKISFLLLMAVVATFFSSCLGDDDNSYPIYGTGTVTNEFNSEVTLDNGLIVSLSGLNSSTLASVERIFIAGTVADETYKGEQLNPGDRLTVIPQQWLSLYDVESWNNDSEEDKKWKDFDNFSWFSGYGNGYINLAMSAECILKNENSSSSLQEPDFYYYIDNIDKDAKIVKIVLGYDNRKESFLKENNTDLKDGYVARTLQLAFSLSTSRLYSRLTNEFGLSDDTNITIRFYKEYVGSNNQVEKEELSLSPNSFKIEYLKRQYGGGY